MIFCIERYAESTTSVNYLEAKVYYNSALPPKEKEGKIAEDITNEVCFANSRQWLVILF